MQEGVLKRPLRPFPAGLPNSRRKHDLLALKDPPPPVLPQLYLIDSFNKCILNEGLQGVELTPAICPAPLPTLPNYKGLLIPSLVYLREHLHILQNPVSGSSPRWKSSPPASPSLALAWKAGAAASAPRWGLRRQVCQIKGMERPSSLPPRSACRLLHAFAAASDPPGTSERASGLSPHSGPGRGDRREGGRGRRRSAAPSSGAPAFSASPPPPRRSGKGAGVFR